MKRRSLTRVFLMLICLTPSCREPARPVTGTGAGEAAQGFYAGLLVQDWSRAYQILSPASRKRCTEQQFIARAIRHLQRMGFEPKEMHLRSCDERGKDAIAHITLTGHNQTHQRFYKDALALVREETGWYVTLSPLFGQ